MKETKGNGGKGRGRCESSNPKKRKDVEYRHDLYKRNLETLSEDERELIETYRQAMLSGINKITRGYGLEELENWEDVKEEFLYEVITPRIPLYVRGDFSIPQAVQLAKELTLKRQGSWYRSVFRQRENLQIYPDDFIVERDEEGEVCGVASALPDWAPPSAPMDPYRTDPEAYLLRVEEIEHVKKLPEIVGVWGKWASLYQRILEIQLSGEDVGPRHREMLGVETNKKLIEFTWQAKHLAEEKSAETFPDLKERQKVYKDQKGKKWKIQKSTSKERRALYRDPFREQIKPSPVRHLKVVTAAQKPLSEAPTTDPLMKSGVGA